MASLDSWLVSASWQRQNAARCDHAGSCSVKRCRRCLIFTASAAPLDELAPESIAVPSGNIEKTSRTTSGKPPVLAVKLQELFGLADTPRIAKGKILVTLHLLSPAQRPIQVTQDLRGFWERTYPDVKKGVEGPLPAPPVAGLIHGRRHRRIAQNRAGREGFRSSPPAKFHNSTVT